MDVLPLTVFSLNSIESSWWCTLDLPLLNEGIDMFPLVMFGPPGIPGYPLAFCIPFIIIYCCWAAVDPWLKCLPTCGCCPGVLWFILFYYTNPEFTVFIYDIYIMFLAWFYAGLLNIIPALGWPMWLTFWEFNTIFIFMWLPGWWCILLLGWWFCLFWT